MPVDLKRMAMIREREKANESPTVVVGDLAGAISWTSVDLLCEDVSGLHQPDAGTDLPILANLQRVLYSVC